MAATAELKNVCRSPGNCMKAAPRRTYKASWSKSRTKLSTQTAFLEMAVRGLAKQAMVSSCAS